MNKNSHTTSQYDQNYAHKHVVRFFFVGATIAFLFGIIASIVLLFRDDAINGNALSLLCVGFFFLFAGSVLRHSGANGESVKAVEDDTAKNINI